MTVRTVEPATIDELIDDCASLPDAMQPAHRTVPEPRDAPAWHVDDSCAASVAALDDYGCS